MLKIEYVDVAKLKPYDKNTRKHEDYDVSQIAKSIEQYGFNDPIGIWGKDNIIVEGHGRLLAAKKLGMKEVPCIRLDDLTDKQRREYAILHNKTAELSSWDFDLLAEDIGELDFSGFDIDWGFPENEEETEIVEDEPPEVDEESEPICKLGDIWQLGRHKLICGDSTDKATVERLMDGKKADMVFTDPPYGVKYTRHIPSQEKKFDMIQNDDKILDFFPAIKDYSNGFVFVCTNWKVLDKWLLLFKNYFDLSNIIIWNKCGGGMGDIKTTFAVDYEIILCASRKNKIKGKRIGSVWECKKDSGNTYKHPTQKPVHLSSIAINHTTENNEIVLDLFGGSGSTLIACEQLNRVCYMCELDPKYCDVIIKRWENLTGNKAIKIS